MSGLLEGFVTAIVESALGRLRALRGHGAALPGHPAVLRPAGMSNHPTSPDSPGPGDPPPSWYPSLNDGESTVVHRSYPISNGTFSRTFHISPASSSPASRSFFHSSGTSITSISGYATPTGRCPSPWAPVRFRSMWAGRKSG